MTSRNHSRSSRVLGVFALLMLISCSRAGAGILSATDVGWYNSQGEHLKFSKGYMMGNAGAFDGDQYRAYFLFNVFGITKTITSASIEIYTAGDGYDSPDASEKLVLWDVSTAATSLMAGQSYASGIYTDLGTGTVFGSSSVEASSTGWVSTTLNAAGLTALNASRGSKFAVGGSVASQDYLGKYINELIFTSGYTVSEVRINYTLGPPPILAATAAPEPSTLLCACISGASSLGVFALRRRGPAVWNRDVAI